ncbi:hypothetical protein BC629DRAFT_1526364 [Irpex lacteus]|nr:hypothetical protein BC629DRAFT_1526364 [Irpex lacteus]
MTSSVCLALSETLSLSLAPLQSVDMLSASSLRYGTVAISIVAYQPLHQPSSVSEAIASPFPHTSTVHHQYCVPNVPHIHSNISSSLIKPTTYFHPTQYRSPEKSFRFSSSLVIHRYGPTRRFHSSQRSAKAPLVSPRAVVITQDERI